MTRGLVAAGLVLSGAAGLAYQVCWIRAASLGLGSTQLAVATVVAVFFLGLALGSEAAGRLAPRARRPLRALGAVELAIAAAAALVLAGLDLADRLFGAVYRASGEGGALPGLARAALLGAVVLPPTVLMGATLPLACRGLVRQPGGVVGGVGTAYAVNTRGAVAGCAGAGLVLLPALGLAGATALAVAANLAAALAFGAASRGAPAAAAPAAAAPSAAAPPAARDVPPVLVAVVFLTGAAALGGEVLWTRFLGFVVRHTAETYTLALAVVLAGIVLGSALAARVSVRPRARAATFGALQIANGFAFFALLHLPPELWQALGGRLLPLALLLLVPAVLSGASLPLAAGLGISRVDGVAGGVGRLLAANTLGGIAGSLLVGFAALPALGMDATVSLLAGLSLAAGLVAWRGLGGGSGAPAGAAGALARFAAAHLAPLTRLPEDWLAPGARLVAHVEGRTATLSVEEDARGRHLRIDRWWQGSDRWTHQALAAHVPMLLHPRPERVLLVGVGTGQTAARFLLHGATRLERVGRRTGSFVCPIRPEVTTPRGISA